MHLNHYPIEAAASGLAYDFVSEGPKGHLRKTVLFDPLGAPGHYNPGFGDLSEDGNTLDNLVVSDNSDMKKVLATVAAIVSDFSAQHPEAVIYAAGSTPARTRLYRMQISNNFTWLSSLFDIYGYGRNGWERFRNSERYEAFYVRKKR